MEIVAGIIIVIATLCGVILNAIALPGIWFGVVVSVLCWWWQPELFSPWTIGVVVGMGLLAELCEFLAGAVGARAAGGSRRAAMAAIVGGIVGALVGSSIMIIVGTLIGGALGAGIAAALFEPRGPLGTDPLDAGPDGYDADDPDTPVGPSEQQPGPNRFRIGRGAAAGWLLAVLIKTTFSVIIALTLSIAAFVP